MIEAVVERWHGFVEHGASPEDLQDLLSDDVVFY